MNINRVANSASNASYSASNTSHTTNKANTSSESVKNETEKTSTATTSMGLVEAITKKTETDSLVQEEGTEEQLPAEKVKRMTDSLNKILDTTNTKLRFEFHEDLEKYYVTIVDKNTDKVVQEIPNRKLMDMYASMLEFVGFLVDKKI